MATGSENEFLFQAATYLGATAIAVPLFKRLRLGTILGFLAAGVILGPSGFGLLEQEEGVFHVAELGVVLFLFVIGLELSYRRLWALRANIIGLGLPQMVITGLVIGYGLEFFDVLTRGPAMIVGFGLAASSTAFALSLLEERRELNAPHGVKAFSVLLFQDVAVIPLLAAIPIVAAAVHGDGDALRIEWQDIGWAAAALIAVIVVAKFVLDFIFRLVAVSGSREAFTATALFSVAATALIVDAAGLSMALGAFLAGVVLAESSFRHQIENDIEPFRELLLGLFFIGVGMQLDLSVLQTEWALIIGAALGLILLKAAIIFLLVKIRASGQVSLRTAATLSQGGEFGFVVFTLSADRGLIDSQMATILSAIVTLSMIATPLIMMAVTYYTRERPGDVQSVHDDMDQGRALIVGYGRMGQIVNNILQASGVDTVAIDSDPRRIEMAARFGNKVYFGNGADPRLLIQAGALEADIIIFTLDARDSLKTAVSALRERCPTVPILARVHDRLHEIEMMDVRTDFVVREMFEGSVLLARKSLEHLNFSDATIDDIEQEFRERDRERLLAQRAEGIYAGKDVLKKPFEAIAPSGD